MDTKALAQTPTQERLADPYVNRVLDPYLVRYLHQVTIERPEPDKPQNLADVCAVGQFSIPESCYIRNTGHFNAVEFNICYNQLVYVLIAYLVREKLIAPLSYMDMDTFYERQLPDILIVKYGCKFKKEMQSHHVTGRIHIDNVLKRGRSVLLRTQVSFKDRSGGSSAGEIMLAVVRNP